MWSSPEFWVFIAFLLFLGLFGRKGLSALNQLITDHQQKITQHLEEAQRLRDEALSLLNSYKEKHAEALEQAEKMMDLAKKEAAEFKKSSEEEFNKLLAHKEKMLLERIARETEEAKAKLRQQAANEAFAIVEKHLSKDEKTRKKLTAASLKEIERRGRF